MTIQAYIDASGTGSELFVFAGHMATAEKWLLFSNQWNKRLKDYNIRVYKACDMSNVESDIEMSSHFYEVIEEHVDLQFSLSLCKSDLSDAVNDIDWPPHIKKVHRLKNAYYFGFKALVNLLLQNSKSLNINGTVDFVFDTESESKDTMKLWNDIRKGSSSDVAILMGDLEYKDDKESPPLQAADLYAYWMRKLVMQCGQNVNDENPFQWKIKKDLLSAHIWFTKEDLIKELSRGI